MWEKGKEVITVRIIQCYYIQCSRSGEGRRRRQFEGERELKGEGEGLKRDQRSTTRPTLSRNKRISFVVFVTQCIVCPEQQHKRMVYENSLLHPQVFCSSERMERSLLNEIRNAVPTNYWNIMIYLDIKLAH